MGCGCGKCNCRIISTDESVDIEAIVGGYNLSVTGGGGGGGDVVSVFGRTGTVVAASGDYNATLVSNAPSGGIVAVTVQAALNELDADKEAAYAAGTTGQYYRGDKTWQTLNSTAVGLGNVNNTSDTSKPVSTAQQAALDLKQDLDSDLTAIAALTATNDDIIQRKSGAWTNRTMAQLKTDLALTSTDVGLGNVTNDAQITKALLTAKGQVISATASATPAVLAVGTDGHVLTLDSSTATGLKWDAAGGGGGAVSSFNTRTGAVTAASGDYTATQVTNTPAGNIAATDVQTALNELDTEKQPLITATTSADYYRGDKTFQTLNKTAVGLSNVDNTADTAKPVSTLQQAAIDAKVADAINDGTTTIAPSQNAVFDALALKQTLDTELTALAGLTSAADQVPYFTGSGTASLFTVTSAARGVLDETSTANMLTALGAQGLDSTLTSLAGYNVNGLLTQTSADNFTGRTLTGTSNRITVTNGNGVSGNPTVTIAAQNVTPVVTLTSSGGTATIDASLGNHFRITLTENTTFAAPSNPVDGQIILLEIIQHASAAKTIAYNAAFKFNTTYTAHTMTVTVSKTDLVALVYQSTLSGWIVAGITQGA